MKYNEARKIATAALSADEIVSKFARLDTVLGQTGIYSKVQGTDFRSSATGSATGFWRFTGGEWNMVDVPFAARQGGGYNDRETAVPYPAGCWVRVARKGSAYSYSVTEILIPK